MVLPHARLVARGPAPPTLGDRPLRIAYAGMPAAHKGWEVFRDLAARKVDILTIGQYLRPSRDHLPMTRYYTPEEFAFLKTEALKMGFRHVESGPLVRSSYHAHEQAESTGLISTANSEHN